MKARKKWFRLVLERRLRGRIPGSDFHFLPSGFHRIGDIIIVNIPRELEGFSGDIGEAVLSHFRNVRTVCRKAGSISGEYREPGTEKIAGDGTETVHRENGCSYKLDVSRLMFSKGNVTERGRIAGLVKPGERIVDMFAGIGYFSMPIARKSPSCRICAIEKNPVAAEYLRENCRLNRVSNMEVIHNDCRKVNMENTADRVLMGYLPKTYEFLPYAFGFLKDRGVIHYHDTFRRDELWDRPVEILERHASEAGYRIEKIAYKKIVKPYAPSVHHTVMDVSVVRA